MMRRILLVIKELKIASEEELFLALKDYFGNLREKTLKGNLDLLEKDRAIFKILPDENEDNFIGYILGPNAEVEEDLEVNRLLLEKELFPRSLAIINWETFSKRLLNEMLVEVNDLKERIVKLYDSPKELELNYFDLSLKYHELYSFFYENYNADFLTPIHDLLNECRGYLDKIEYG